MQLRVKNHKQETWFEKLTNSDLSSFIGTAKKKKVLQSVALW